MFDASFSVGAGEIVGIIGANGSGKSTLLRCATLFEPIDAGEVTLGDWTFRATDRNGGTSSRKIESLRGAFVGTVFQDSRPWPHLSVKANVVLPLVRAMGLPRPEADERAEQALERLGILDRATSKPWQLSGGLRQRLVLARALAMEPRVLLIDEGTSALDPDWTERVRKLLREYSRQGAAVGVISHQVGFVSRLADYVLFLHAGRILEEGRPTEVFSSPETDQLTSFLANA